MSNLVSVSLTFLNKKESNYADIDICKQEESKIVHFFTP